MIAGLKYFLILQCVSSFAWSFILPYWKYDDSSISSSEDSDSYSTDEYFDSYDYPIDDFEKPEIDHYTESSLYSFGSSSEDSYDYSDYDYYEDDQDDEYPYPKWDDIFRKFKLLSLDDEEWSENNDYLPDNYGPYKGNLITRQDIYPSDNDYDYDLDDDNRYGIDERDENYFNDENQYDNDDYGEYYSDDDNQSNIEDSDNYCSEGHSQYAIDGKDHKRYTNKREKSLSGDPGGIRYIDSEVPEYSGSSDDWINDDDFDYP